MATVTYYYRTSDPDDGLQAMLRTRPEEVISWVENAPLRLIGAALADMQGAGKAGDLQHRLERPVLERTDVRWQTWWKKVQPTLKESRFFRYNKQIYSLAPSVRADSIPLEPVVTKTTGTIRQTGEVRRVPANPNLQLWLQWLWAKEELPCPGNLPPGELASLMRLYPEEILPQASARIITAAAEIIGQSGIASRTSQAWLSLILTMGQRGALLFTEEPVGNPQRGMPSVLAQLMAAIKQRDALQKYLEDFKTLVEGNTRWRVAVASGIWRLWYTDSEDGRRIVELLANQLTDRQKIAFAGDIIAAALSDSDYHHEHGLDRLIDRIRPSSLERAMLVAVLWAAQGVSSPREVAKYAATRPYRQNTPNNPGTLDTLLAAALLLPQGQNQLLPSITAAFRNALRDSTDLRCSPLISSLTEAANLENEAAKLELQVRLNEEYESHVAEVASMRNAEERLKSQIATLRAELTSTRESSKLDIRRDMLQVVVATLVPLMGGQNDREGLFRDVEAGLQLALQAGGAELYGTVGEPVEFDFNLHQSPEATDPNSSVTTRRQGIRVPGAPPAGDLILLKALVGRN